MLAYGRQYDSRLYCQCLKILCNSRGLKIHLAITTRDLEKSENAKNKCFTYSRKRFTRYYLDGEVHNSCRTFEVSWLCLLSTLKFFTPL